MAARPRGWWCSVSRALRGALALALALAATSARAQESPLLGGYLPLDGERLEHWGWSGAWVFPVGDRFDYTRADDGGDGGFTLLRGVQREGRGHTGADLGDGHAGGPVRAAAAGLVVRVSDAAGGYGRHVVLAHRLADGGLAYTVYAHLGPGGPPLQAGEAVGVGQPIGVVGRSGRASTDHLHFEVRRPVGIGERWEKAPAVDPLAFVAERLPAPIDGWSAPLVMWGEGGDLVRGDDDPGGPLARSAWWRMLWRSARHRGDLLPDGPRSLGEALVAASVLPEGGRRSRTDVVTWDELVRDLERLRTLGLRLAPAPPAAAELRAWCERELGAPRPGREPGPLRHRRGTGPTMTQALLALADLASP